MRHPIVTAALSAALATAACAAHAHHPWLLPSHTVVDHPDGWVAIDAAATEDLFEFDTRGIALDGLVVTGPDGARVAPGPVNGGSRHRTSVELRLERPGTYRIANVSQGVLVSYRLQGEARRFRGSAEAWDQERPAQAEDVRVTRTDSRLETFVARQRPGEVSFAPVGAGLELMPLDPPVDLSDGDRTRFRLLLDGRPLAGAAVSLLRGGNRYRYRMGELTLRSDERGEFAVAWPEPGRYWLGVNHSEGGTDAGAPPARRASYSATFEVRPR